MRSPARVRGGVGVVRKATLLAAGALVFALAAPGVAHAAPAAGTFTVQAVNTNPNDPTVQAYFTISLAAGQTTTRQVRVSNPTTTPVSLLVNGVDGITATTSGAVYANRQDPVKKAGAWIKPAVASLTVGPNSSTKISFTVAVPKGTVAGDHLGGIAVQNAQTTTSGKGFQIKQVLRTVIGVLVKVPGAASFHARVDAVSLQNLAGPNVAAVMVGLLDDGLALGKPTLTARITGPNHYDRTLTRTLDTLLPGDPITYPMMWNDNLASGKYTVTVQVSGGGTTATATKSATLTLSSALKGVSSLNNTTGNSPAPGNPASTANNVPWLLVILVAIGGIGAGVLARRIPQLRHHEARAED